MNPILLLLSIVISLLLISCPRGGEAQVAPVILRDGVYVPVHHEQIRLDSEVMIMRLNWQSYTVDSVFHFFNTGDATKAWVGTPIAGSGPPASQVPGWAGYTKYKFISFHGWINGRSAKFFEAPGPLPHLAENQDKLTPRRHYEKCGWMMVKEVLFAARTSTTIRVRYEVAYVIDLMTNVAGYDRSIGRYWKDRIGGSILIVDGTFIGHPGGLKTHGLGDTRNISVNLIKYEQMDYEPTPEYWLGVSFPRQGGG